MSEIKAFFEKKENSFSCKRCGTHLKIQESGTTSHLWTHLERKHSDLYKKATEAKDEKNKEREKDRGKRPASGPPPAAAAATCKKQMAMASFMVQKVDGITKRKYDDAVLKWIVSDGRPFEAAAGEGFKNLLSVITNKSYDPPHPTTLSRKLVQMREKLEAALGERIRTEKNQDTKLSLTFDHWKADNADNFLVLTVHFISTDWQLVSICLSVVNLEEIDADHTAAACNRIIREQLEKYQVAIDDVLYVTTDTTNTMPCAARMLGIDWQGCGAHMLQLAINKALDAQPNVKRLISHVHKISTFFHSSTTGLASLHKFQISEGLKESNPPEDVVTRFNSTYKLLDWTSKNMTAISHALVDSSNRKNTVTSPPATLPQDLINVLRAVIPILRPTAEATGILSADQHVSISMFVPCITTLKNQLVKADARGIRAFRDKLVSEIDNRFDTSSEHLQAATVLDCRFKNVIASRQDEIKVHSFIEQLLVGKGAGQDHEPMATPSSDELNVATDEEGTSLFDAMFTNLRKKKATETAAGNTLNEQIKNQLQQYCSTPVDGKHADPLEYWRRNESTFPLLAKAAKDLMGIQATNTSSERTNSVGGNIITDSRHSLSRGNAETLIWSKKNKVLVFNM